MGLDEWHGWCAACFSVLSKSHERAADRENLYYSRSSSVYSWDSHFGPWRFVYLRDEESQTAFGSDLRTQIFALSICALAHTVRPQEAVIILFMDWLAPALLCGIT